MSKNQCVPSRVPVSHIKYTAKEKKGKEEKTRLHTLHNFRTPNYEISLFHQGSLEPRLKQYCCYAQGRIDCRPHLLGRTI